MSDVAISFGSAFKRDLKKHFVALASTEWAEVLYCLTQSQALPEKYRDHALSGNWDGFRECHVKPDLLLIYVKTDNLLQLVRLGTHSELF